MGFFMNLFRKKQQPATEQRPEQNGYRQAMDTATVIKHNTLMNGVTSTRGEAMGFVQENFLRLLPDGAFEMTKELKSTKTNLLMKVPVSVKYVFTGRYTKDGNTVTLSPAQTGRGHVDWGTISRFLDTGNGDYDSRTSPGILSLYPTAFFVENCKNVSMTVRLDETAHTFSIDEFEPVILSPEEAGSVEKHEQALDENAGLMQHPPVTGPNPYVLKDAFAAQGMKIGTCINPAYIEPPYAELLLSQFSSVTLENHLKPESILSRELSQKTGQLSVAFSKETIRLLDWCKEHHLPVRGHTLIWYIGTPEWTFHEDFRDDALNVDRTTLLRRMEEMISGYFKALEEGGWSETLYCQDVVNEAIIAPDQMRKCPWQEIIGDDYVFHAYQLARKYAPVSIKLCYNDFDLETKANKTIELVNSLKDEQGRTLIDVVGQQGHYGAYSSIATLTSALRKISQATGCELQITELDVSISRQGTEEELKTQGRFYYDFMQQIHALRAEGVSISAITLWGFADALSWMPSGFLHIYDRNLVPKYAYYGLLGLKEYAGFDENTAEEVQQTFMNLRLICEHDEAKAIQIRDDGTFTDTVTGTEITGRYRYDGKSTVMLIPKAGGYCNLILSDDRKTAQRVEAAGNEVTMHIVE